MMHASKRPHHSDPRAFVSSSHRGPSGRLTSAVGRIVRGLWPERFDTRVVVTSAEAYALWPPDSPPRAHNPLMEAEEAVMAPILASTSPGRALDVGTGSGRNLPILAATGAQIVVGVDLSLAML